MMKAVLFLGAGALLGWHARCRFDACTEDGDAGDRGEGLAGGALGLLEQAGDVATGLVESVLAWGDAFATAIAPPAAVPEKKGGCGCGG